MSNIWRYYIIKAINYLENIRFARLSSWPSWAKVFIIFLNYNQVIGFDKFI